MADQKPTTDPYADETWKPVVGWEGFYEVSSHGRVWSCRTRRFLKFDHSQMGHCRVTFSYKGKHDRRLVHRIVVEAFAGEIPDGMMVCHNDGDPTNNHVENLRIDTQSSNILDTLKHGTNPNSNKTRCPKGHPYSSENLVISRGGRGRECRKCRNASSKRSRDAAVAAPRKPLKLGGSCPKGHVYDEANTSMSRAGYRYCKACNRDRVREHAKTKREARTE